MGQYSSITCRLVFCSVALVKGSNEDGGCCLIAHPLPFEKFPLMCWRKLPGITAAVGGFYGTVR